MDEEELLGQERFLPSLEPLTPRRRGRGRRVDDTNRGRSRLGRPRTWRVEARSHQGRGTAGPVGEEGPGVRSRRRPDNPWLAANRGGFAEPAPGGHRLRTCRPDASARARERASRAPSIPAQFPVLTDEQVASVARRGTRHVTTAGEVLYAAGDRGYDFIVIEAGEVDAPETLIAMWGRGRFLGELNLLTGQTAIATARVRSGGVVCRIAPAQFRELMAEDADVSDLVLRVLLARCESLRRGEGARVLEILASQMSPATHALHPWASRQELPHTWLDVDVVGGGPRGLAAAVYGASEGLRTMLLDSIAVAGQAASNTRMENYLGPEREPRPCRRAGDEQRSACIRGRRVPARCPKTAAVAR